VQGIGLPVPIHSGRISNSVRQFKHSKLTAGTLFGFGWFVCGGLVGTVGWVLNSPRTVLFSGLIGEGIWILCPQRGQGIFFPDESSGALRLFWQAGHVKRIIGGCLRSFGGLIQNFIIDGL
jgi:hypothetical protein